MSDFRTAHAAIIKANLKISGDQIDAMVLRTPTSLLRNKMTEVRLLIEHALLTGFFAKSEDEVK